MKWIEKYLSKNEVEKISSLITKLESRTRAEIVPMIVRQSTSFGHVRLSLFLILLCVSLVIEVPLAWSFSYAEYFAIGAILVSFAASVVLAKFSFFQRLLTPAEDQWAQVHSSAELEFHRQGLDKTAEHVAVLLYVSVAERKAVVLADVGISSKLDDKFWQDSLNVLLAEMKKGQWHKGFEESLTKIGAVLAEHFPAKQHEQNQLPNSLIIRN